MIGLIPAAGHAVRCGGLPKYLFPVGATYLLADLCRRLRIGGAGRLLIGTNSDNLVQFSQHTPADASLYIVNSQTMSETVLAARAHFDTREPVCFGMPDTYWQDDSIYPRLARDIRDGAVVSVGLFRARPGQHKKAGMVEAAFDDDDLIVKRVIDKPTHTTMTMLWGAVAWSPAFWQYIELDDPHIGFAIQRAIEARVTVRGQLARGDYWDAGTPEEYLAMVRHSEAVKA